MEVAQGEPVNLDQERVPTCMLNLSCVGGAAQRPTQEVALPGTFLTNDISCPLDSRPRSTRLRLIQSSRTCEVVVKGRARPLTKGRVDWEDDNKERLKDSREGHILCCI